MSDRAPAKSVAILLAELRTRLSAIRTAAELIERARVSGDHARRVHDKAVLIERSVDDMDGLIAHLSDLLDIESGAMAVELRPHDVREIVDQVRNDLAEAARARGIELATAVGADLPQVPLDRERIRQVLATLTRNALEGTPERGRISLVAERQPSGVRLSVSDDGDGLDGEWIHHLFDREWHPTQMRQAAHDIGMYVATGIVEAHGGALRADSHPGHGCTLSFVIPYESRPGAAQLTPETNPLRGARK